MTSSATSKDKEMLSEAGRVTMIWVTIVSIAALALLFFGDTLMSLTV